MIVPAPGEDHTLPNLCQTCNPNPNMPDVSWHALTCLDFVDVWHRGRGQWRCARRSSKSHGQYVVSETQVWPLGEFFWHGTTSLPEPRIIAAQLQHKNQLHGSYFPGELFRHCSLLFLSVFECQIAQTYITFCLWHCTVHGCGQLIGLMT